MTIATAAPALVRLRLRSTRVTTADVDRLVAAIPTLASLDAGPSLEAYVAAALARR